MKTNKMETTMDMNRMIDHIINSEEHVTSVNCPLSVEDTGLYFEEMQKRAGILSDLTWDRVWTNDVPVIKRKNGRLKENYNYAMFSVEMPDDDTAKSYTEDCGKKLLLALQKQKLDNYLYLAYVRDNILYIMVNSVDNNGRKFTGKEDSRMVKVFAGK